MTAKQISALFLFALRHVSSAATRPGSCILALGLPAFAPECVPLKAESVSVAPPPKFLYSTDRFASITINIDKIQAGRTCFLTTYASPGCQGDSQKTATSGGCVTVSALPLTQAGGAISARLSCFWAHCGLVYDGGCREDAFVYRVRFLEFGLSDRVEMRNISEVETPLKMYSWLGTSHAYVAVSHVWRLIENFVEYNHGDLRPEWLTKKGSYLRKVVNWKSTKGRQVIPHPSACLQPALDKAKKKNRRIMGPDTRNRTRLSVDIADHQRTSGGDHRSVAELGLAGWSRWVFRIAGLWC